MYLATKPLISSAEVFYANHVLIWSTVPDELRFNIVIYYLHRKAT